MDWTLQQKVESWMREQRSKISWAVKWPVVVINWPWTNGNQQRKRIKEELERRKRQLVNLCHAVKANNLSDLQDILCCMLLSECVYKVHFPFLLIPIHTYIHHLTYLFRYVALPH